MASTERSKLIGDSTHAQPVDVTQHQRRPIGRVETSQHHRRHTGIDRRRFLDPGGSAPTNGQAPDCGRVVLVPANDRRACAGRHRSAMPDPRHHQPRHDGHQPRTRPESDLPPPPSHQRGWRDTNTHRSRCAHREPRSRTDSPPGPSSSPPLCASPPTSLRTSRFRRFEQKNPQKSS